MALLVGILVLAVGRQGGGPETYERELLRALARIDQETQYRIYCTGEDAEQALGIQQSNFSYRILRPQSRLLSLSFSLPKRLRAEGVDVLHATFAPPPFSPVPLVFTCHGLVNFNFPHLFPRLQLLRLNALHRRALRRASEIICVSEHTYCQVQDELEIGSSRLHLIHHGIDPLYSPGSQTEARQQIERTWNVKGPFILFVGKLQQVKNVGRLLEAFSRYRQQHNPTLQLVLAGRPVEQIPQLAVPELRTNVVQLGYLSSAQLLPLYRAAELMVLPSLFESFGLPVLEAMSCGTPVIASQGGALPEICGDAAYFLDSPEESSIFQALEEVLGSPERQAQLRASGFERVKAFSWEMAARRTLDVYRKAAGRTAPE